MEPGLILLNKKPDITSFRALSSLKGVYGPKLGHAGTLDHFAQGLLLVMLGCFTKLNRLFMPLDKTYEAEFTFGYETSTLDKNGQRVFEGPIPNAQTIFSFRDHFLGQQEQIPPIFSAVHVQGKRAYQRALASENLTLAPRIIAIHQIDILSWQSPRLYLRIHCSKGTYIRSLARDWGRLVQAGATVTQLKRTSIGPFQLPQEEQEFLSPKQCCDLLGIPMLQTQEKKRVLHGVPLSVLSLIDSHLQGQNSPFVSLWYGEQFLALGEKEKSRWRYLVINTGLGIS